MIVFFLDEDYWWLRIGPHLNEYTDWRYTSEEVAYLGVIYA